MATKPRSQFEKGRDKIGEKAGWVVYLKRLNRRRIEIYVKRYDKKFHLYSGQLTWHMGVQLTFEESQKSDLMQRR